MTLSIVPFGHSEESQEDLAAVIMSSPKAEAAVQIHTWQSHFDTCTPPYVEWIASGKLLLAREPQPGLFDDL